MNLVSSSGTSPVIQGSVSVRFLLNGPWKLVARFLFDAINLLQYLEGDGTGAHALCVLNKIRIGAL